VLLKPLGPIFEAFIHTEARAFEHRVSLLTDIAALGESGWSRMGT
jgi:hypothetical protein